MPDDFSLCFVSNSRMAARAITRRYDRYLRGHGVTATQLSLLGSMQTNRGRNVSALAEDIGFERTTLTRNLDRLERLGLVASEARGNRRVPEITPKGQALLEQLLPLWRKAQAEMAALLDDDGFDASLKVLKRLATV